MHLKMRDSPIAADPQRLTAPGKANDKTGSKNVLGFVIRPLGMITIIIVEDHRLSYRPNPIERRYMIHQLRIYEIFEHNKAAFHKRFREHAGRIMQTYGFHILAMWETKTDRRTEFVYILEWQDESAMRAAWTNFMADQEWKEIKRITSAEHGDLVGEIEERVLLPTDYSPGDLRTKKA